MFKLLTWPFSANQALDCNDSGKGKSPNIMINVWIIALSFVWHCLAMILASKDKSLNAWLTHSFTGRENRLHSKLKIEWCKSKEIGARKPHSVTNKLNFSVFEVGGNKITQFRIFPHKTKNNTLLRDPCIIIQSTGSHVAHQHSPITRERERIFWVGMPHKVVRPAIMLIALALPNLDHWCFSNSIFWGIAVLAPGNCEPH